MSDDELLFLALGVIIGFGLTMAVIASADVIPIEQSMQAKCTEIGAELESYDWGDFVCTNGASFDRSILTTQDDI